VSVSSRVEQSAVHSTANEGASIAAHSGVQSAAGSEECLRRGGEVQGLLRQVAWQGLAQAVHTGCIKSVAFIRPEALAAEEHLGGS
jgi:hypothetical protein